MTIKKKRHRLLSILLCCIMLVGLFPTHAHAWDEVVECEYCGSICGDEYICSGGDHCSESSGRSCYEEHHCRSCGECENNADEWCEDCHMCVECAIDEECHCAECGNCFVEYPPCPGGCGRCGECVDEWCDSCGMCVECAIEEGNHCPDCGACTTEEGCLICHRCFDCGGQCNDGCTDACLTCHLENEKACEECGACFVNDDSNMCIICHTCADCAGDFCDDCHMCVDCAIDEKCHCEECGNCFVEYPPCSGGCGRCGECVDEWCDSCEMCVECAIEKGDHCPDCGACTTEEGCLICHRCFDCGGQCGDGCTDACLTCHLENDAACEECGACFVNDDSNMCTICRRCADCAGDFCDDCHMCVDCAIDEKCHCEECGNCFVEYPPCPGGCGRCGECVDEWCDSCEMCVECAIEKGDHCPDCGACTTEEGCLICHRCFDCGGQCGDGCTDACLTCHLENEKACEECGACFVNDDSNMCTICRRCADCAGDFCDDCHMCVDCAIDEKCHCEECGSCFVDHPACPGGCGRCGECVDEWCDSCGMCVECATENGDHCPNCAACYDKENNPCLGDCDRCSECADDWCEDCQMCVECAVEAGNHCPDCEACTTEEGCLICHRCGECAELCIKCGDYCHDCVPTCESCGTCENCATICDNCGSVCTDCGTMCPDCGLCEECCADNSGNAGCNHDVCIKSDEWETHWSEQHAGQEHTHIYDDYSYDANGHWYACCVGSCSERTDSEDHSFSGWSIIKPSNCKENGIRVRKCMVCGYRVTETITNGNHIISDWESDETHHWKECTVVGCGVVIDGTKAAHTASDWITGTAATATTNGTKHKECTACHRVLETGTIPATGEEHTHSYGSEWKNDADKHWHECSCGAKSEEAAHTTSDWITDTAATATTDGTKHKECTVCHRVLKTGTISATGSEHTHSYGSEWKSDADNHWYECSCGVIIDGSKAAHTASDWITDTAATATATGTKHKECTTCHRTLETGTIPATGGSSSGGGGGSSITYYTLTFNTNGGSSISKITKAKGTTVDFEKYAPTKEGYTFTGWYSDKDLTDKLTSVKLAKDTTVYAGWKAAEKEDTKTDGKDEPKTEELPFADVDEDDWFAKDVEYVYNKGLMSGTDKDTFSFDLTTTRGMIVTVLYRLENKPAVSGSLPFDDVKPDSYYKDAIIWAAENDIVSGYDNGTFGPNDSITREQLAAILWRYAKYAGYDVSVGENTNILSYADVSQISAYAVPAMQWACGEGIISGTSDTTLSPKNDATRAQVAAILHRFCEKLGK